MHIYEYIHFKMFSNGCESITEEILLLAEMKMTGYIYTSVFLPPTPFIFSY